MPCPLRFQKKIYELVIERSPAICVETGFNLGKSAMQFLAALDLIEMGVLYSIENTTPNILVHPRFRFRRGLSHQQMPAVFLESGPWDFFLHDSDHEVGCQTFEYELAWRFLRPGGTIMSDDSWWGQPPHQAWRKFMDRHPIENYSKEGAEHFTKPKTEPMPLDDEDWIRIQVGRCKELANLACAEAGAESYFPEL